MSVQAGLSTRAVLVLATAALGSLSSGVTALVVWTGASQVAGPLHRLAPLPNVEGLDRLSESAVRLPGAPAAPIALRPGPLKPTTFGPATFSSATFSPVALRTVAFRRDAPGVVLTGPVVESAVGRVPAPGAAAPAVPAPGVPAPDVLLAGPLAPVLPAPLTVSRAASERKTGGAPSTGAQVSSAQDKQPAKQRTDTSNRTAKQRADTSKKPGKPATTDQAGKSRNGKA